MGPCGSVELSFLVYGIEDVYLLIKLSTIMDVHRLGCFLGRLTPFMIDFNKHELTLNRLTKMIDFTLT